MKRSAHTAQSSLIETTNYQSPKRSCTPRNRRSVASHSYAAACSSEDISSFTIDEHLQSLISMGFINEDLNRRLLIKTNNDISEVVTLLTSYSYSNSDEIGHGHEMKTSNSFNSPLEQEKNSTTANASDDQSTNPDEESSDTNETFATEAFLDLEKRVYGDNWSIPYKQDEPLGQCLLSAIKLTLAGKADQDKHCQRFMDELVPEAFLKLQNSNYVNNWAVEIQNGVFDMVNLLVDLIAARLSYSPIPVRLLETLAILFNCDTVFQKKHRTKPYDRSLYHKQLGERVLASPPSTSTFAIYGHNDPYGWLCEIINRFVFKDGIVHLKRQFQTDRPLTSREFNALLIPFVNCLEYISIDKYRNLFGEHVEKAIDHLQNLKEEDFKAKSSNYIFELLATIRKIYSVAFSNRLDIVEKLYLTTLLNMIVSSNFNAKMNSLKELAKLIENSTSNTPKILIRRDVISQWIIDNSILSKALEGNIDQNQYVDQVRILMDFIAPKISKEDIKTIWKLQHGRSSVAVDHLFTLIASAAAKFNLEQLNHLIEFISESWKNETILIQEKLVELLGTIGRDGPKEAATRVLEVLWNIAHEERLNRSMLDHLLRWHLKIFSESRSSFNTLKREYCLKCVADLQRKQGWLIPAIRHLYDLLHHDSTNTFKRNENDLVSILVHKNELIFILIQSLSQCQHDVWTKTRGNVTIDTLVDGRFTHEESVKTHLDLLSFLLKKGNLFLTLKSSEDLWDTLITNDQASSFDHELGLNWFITCVQDLNQETQIALFKKRVSKLDPLKMTVKGYDCFKLYFQRCNFEGRSPPRLNNYLLSPTTSPTSPTSSTNNPVMNYEGLNEFWNIILCVKDDNLADRAAQFLLDLYYSKQMMPTRSLSAATRHQYFLQTVYTRLSSLLRTAVLPSTKTSIELVKALKIYGEQLININETSSTSTPMESIDHRLWAKKIERLLMLTEEYIHLVESDRSISAHINSFYGLEYRIRVIIGDINRISHHHHHHHHHDIAIVHSNDTLEMLRHRLALFYKVSVHDTHISIPTTRPLPSSKNSCESTNNSNTLGTWLNHKYLYEVQICPATTIYLKFVGTNSNQLLKSVGTETRMIPWTNSPRFAPVRSSSIAVATSVSTPSSMIAENSKIFDILYKLSFLNNENIHRRIRNLLNLMPSDSRIQDRFDEIDSSTRKSSNKGEEILEEMFDLKTRSFLQLVYMLEILSSKILPLSTNNGMQHSSKLFRENFYHQSGVRCLFRFLQSLNQFINDDYQYALAQEILLLIVQLLNLFLCGQNLSIESSTSTNESIQWDFPPIVDQLTLEDFIERLKQLIFLSWAAAAGNLRLQEQNVTIKEQIKLDRHALLQQINKNVFSRQNSKTSFSEDSSIDTSRVQKSVQFGICVKNVTFLPLDGEIAVKLIEMVTFCLEKRPEFLSTFLSQSFFADYLLEILIGTTSSEIRQCAVENLDRLCRIDPKICDLRSVIHQILIKARLPLWCNSSGTLRGSSQKLVSQSLEYFEIRCYLTENLNNEQQKILGIEPMTLLTAEFNWLSTYTFATDSKELQTIDNVLLLGHLKFIRTLLTCENVEKSQFGRNFIHLLLDQYLFPASKKISLTLQSPTKEMFNYDESIDQSAPEPKCSTDESRFAAYEVLVELVRNCYSNLKMVVNELILLHHSSPIEKQIEWEFLPEVSPRAPCGFVGLYNGGATCYMNSILQQLYMIPQISEYILSINDETETKSNGNVNLFSQLQQVFGHLLESKMQYYMPEMLWKVFRLWGQEINVREQQDAFDFFTSMIDQIDEYLKSIKQEEIFRKQFEGVFCNQMICTNGCRHRYEGEERFMALNVAVKVDSLSESLNQFVKGELLDGTNAYFCDKCQEKRTTIKRLCIKKLPPLLCIQMKRFGFDWENNRALKFDDYFRFPFVLNMEPYTLDGVTKRENSSQNDDLNASTINYELIGIVIHSGQANAGHYYSFIKDIRNTSKSNQNQWFRFNDTSVDEIDLNEQMLEEECFGGTFRAQNEKNNSNEERIRFWNAYMLIYQCIEPSKLFPAPAVPSSPNSSILTAKQCRRQRLANENDSLSQLTDLVVQSEQSKLFQTKRSVVPSRVRVCVKDENLEFLRNRDTFCDDYFQFVFNLSNSYASVENDNGKFYQTCTKLTLQFLFSTFLRTHRRLRKDHVNSWLKLVEHLFSSCSTSCSMFYRDFLSENGKLLKLFLLDCPIDDVRQITRQIIEQAIRTTNENHFNDKENVSLMKKLLEQILSLIEKNVVEQIRQSQALFQLIHSLLFINNRLVENLLHLNIYFRLMNFLLGENTENRRWTSTQSKDLTIVHEILSTLAVAAKNSHEKTNIEINEFLQSDASIRYLREISFAFQDVSSSQLTRTSHFLDEFIQENHWISERLIRIILQMIAQANPNDLKSLFKYFHQILSVNDSIQIKRLQMAFEGIENASNINGLYHLIRTSIETEQRRAYQTVKFLTSLAKKSKTAKDFFYSTVKEWESSINWLKQQMHTSGYWSPATNISNDENDTRLFQRTRSAQFTLEDAQTLLQQSSTSINGTTFNDHSLNSPMDVNDNQSQSSSQSTLTIEESSTKV